MWWEDDTIHRTVTRQFVCSHLLPEEIERLDRQPGFGDGLTDGTYWEWINEKAKRFFLILLDIRLPDQIFGVIDDSWDDSDLPIALDQVERLELSLSKDVKLERKFYYRQFHYLLKPIRQGDHVLYEEVDVVPLDVVDGKPVQSRYVDKVVLPNQPGMAFCRRYVPLGSEYGMTYDDFLYQVNDIRRVQNDHLISYWASYVHQGYGYVLFTPASDLNLKSMLATTPTAIKNMTKQARVRLVLNWIHCLVDTLCFIHNRGLSHGNIRPSTVHFTNANHVFFSDLAHLSPELSPSRADKASFDKESYDYIAPEQRSRTNTSATSPIHRKSSLSSPSSPPPDLTFSISRRRAEQARTSAASTTTSRMSIHLGSSAASTMHTSPPYLDDQAADIFSLGCVVLELLSFLMKKQSRTFASHRAAKHKTPGRGGAVPDSSFHKNLGQVESWMTQLAKEASKKDDRVFKGIAPMLHVVERMLATHPSERPPAYEVQNRMYEVLRDTCGIAEPHCVHRYAGWDFGFEGLDLSPVEEVPNGEGSETMSVATGRSAGSHSLSAGYRRTSSRSSSSAWASDSAAAMSKERPRSPGDRPRTANLSGGFQAIRNLRVKADKPRQWQQQPASPVSVGGGLFPEQSYAIF